VSFNFIDGTVGFGRCVRHLNEIRSATDHASEQTEYEVDHRFDSLATNVANTAGVPECQPMRRFAPHCRRYLTRISPPALLMQQRFMFTKV
jgi:hypothetical protein